MRANTCVHAFTCVHTGAKPPSQTLLPQQQQQQQQQLQPSTHGFVSPQPESSSLRPPPPQPPGESFTIPADRDSAAFANPDSSGMGISCGWDGPGEVHAAGPTPGFNAQHVAAIKTAIQHASSIEEVRRLEAELAQRSPHPSLSFPHFAGHATGTPNGTSLHESMPNMVPSNLAGAQQPPVPSLHPFASGQWGDAGRECGGGGMAGSVSTPPLGQWVGSGVPQNAQLVTPSSFFTIGESQVLNVYAALSLFLVCGRFLAPSACRQQEGARQCEAVFLGLSVEFCI